ncbi:MAG: TetR/AcrR family transcriptional regulator [Trebonia sp.]
MPGGSDGIAGKSANEAMNADGFPGAPSAWLPGVIVGLTEQPQQARSRRTTGQILEAAEQLLTAEGAENLTMAAVSKRSGVSIGAIYGRFEGKSGLLRAVKDRALHQMEAELADRYEAPARGIEDVVRRLVQTAAPAARHRLLEPSPETEDALLGHREALARQRLAFMFKDAARGHRQQIAHPSQAVALEVAFRLVMAGIASYDEMTRTSEGDPLPLDTLCEEIVRAVTSYLCGAGAGC